MNTQIIKPTYVVTVAVKHGDLYEQNEDSTDILGVFDDPELAEHRLYEEYFCNKEELAEGLCSEGKNYEITEDNAPATHTGEKPLDYSAKANIVVSETGTGAFEREYQYRIEAKALNRGW